MTMMLISGWLLLVARGSWRSWKALWRSLVRVGFQVHLGTLAHSICVSSEFKSVLNSIFCNSRLFSLFA